MQFFFHEVLVFSSIITVIRKVVIMKVVFQGAEQF